MNLNHSRNSSSAVEGTNEITYYEPKIESQSNFTFDIDEQSCHYDEESIKLKNIFRSKESEFVKELSSKIITTEEEIEEEEWSEEEEENPYISVTSFEYQQSQETIQTTLELEQSSGPFDLCYEEIYDDKGFIKIDEKTFMLIIELYEFLENNIHTMLSSEFTMILPKKLEEIFNYFENFEKVFIENFKWNGQYFYGNVDVKELINQLDNGLGIKQTNYVRINSFGRIFQTNKSPLQPYSPLRPKAMSYDVDCLEDTLRHTVMDENVEQETKDFLNSLAKESEEDDDKNNQGDIETDVDTFGNPRPLNATRKNGLTNNWFNGNETDGSIEEIDGNVSEFSFEELNEMSDIESVTTIDSFNTEWRLV